MDKKTRRQQSLMRYLEQNRYMSLDEIADRFSVTTQTARRDIQELELAGKVRRLHGGATIAFSVDPVTYRSRRIENADAKERIARHAVRRIRDGTTIFLDTGTTCEAVARELVNHKGLRVVTYSLRVANILSEGTDFTVAVPGGFVRPIDGGVFNQNTAGFIRLFKFEMAIISVSSIDLAGDICDDDQAEVEAVKAAMQQSEHTLLAVDSSKFGRRALVHLANLRDIDELVCEKLPDEPYRSMIENTGISFFTPDETPGHGMTAR
ncbi:DeoR/GlpR family DNA-binding transcription regulator [Rhizobium puerariae]|uniref:DeoR/GlpR family DNA-binding transcription regulator n=1 Tax=Rhizobium puerariae TaxID=1585791 RepID=A0ABV6AC81_9HYPH